MFELTLDAAFERSEREHKLLLVAVVAGAPAWLDAEVIERLGRDAIAARVDFEAEQEIALALHVYSPMVLAFHHRNEIDRIREPATPGEVLAWLDRIAGCTTVLEVRRATLAADPTNAEARHRLARALAEDGRIDEATAEWIWLWQHAPIEDGRRPGWLSGQIRRLLDEHPTARNEFAKLRDPVTPPRGRPPDRTAFREWAALNAVLGDDPSTLSWFDETYSKLADKAAIADLVDQALVRPLMEFGRWADAGNLMVDPLARIQKLIFRPPPEPIDSVLGAAADAAIRAAIDAETIARMKKMGSMGRCMFAGMFVRALLAAGRREDARAVGDYALEVDDSPEMHDTLLAEGLAPAN